MAAPQISFTRDFDKVSKKQHITVHFSSDIAYEQFEARATKDGSEYGVGIGALIASFSYTPQETERTFEIYDASLLEGDGLYRLSLFAKSEDGTWNDGQAFFTVNNEPVYTLDGYQFLTQNGVI